MKKYLIYIYCLLMIVWFGVFSAKADYTGFVSNISQYDFDTTWFIKLKQVPRYDIVRLLNYVDCQDCTMPWYGAIDRYSWEWFQAMQSVPGKYFGDIKSRDKVIYNKQDLYYCISYVSDNDYMNGYDKTSPICNGEFCGTNNTSYSEMIQIMSNIVSKKFTGEYMANWSNINKRLSDIKTKNPKVYRSFHIWDLTNISSGTKLWKSIKITDSSSLMTYIKYCTYEPSKCGFGEFSYVKAGQCPIADYNFLIKEGILTKKEAESINIYNYPDGQTILWYIYKLNQKSKCDFNNDYDGDGIVNRKDKNPFVDPNYSGKIYTGKSQTIWALQIISAPMVCLIGSKSIIYPYRSGNIDKLSWDLNSEYVIDNQTSRVYYKCDTVWPKIFTAKSYLNGKEVWISKANIYVVSGNTDKTVKYSSNLVANKLVANIWENILFTTYISGFAVGDIDRIERNMVQDKFTNTKLYINYSYNSVWKKVVVQDIYLKSWYKLQNILTIYILDNSNDKIWSLQILPVPIVCLLGTKSIIYPYRSGNIDQISRNINNEYSIDNQMSRVYYDCNSIGMKTFTAKSYYNGNFVWISKANIYVVNKITDDNKYSSNLIADKLVANIWENILFTTYTSGFLYSDIDHIDRAMMQENITNQDLSLNYVYSSIEKKIVIQDIYLKNWYKLQNAVTVSIIDPDIYINPICKIPGNCPEYSKFDTLKFGDKVRAILQPQFSNDDYVYTDWRDIKNQ